MSKLKMKAKSDFSRVSWDFCWPGNRAQISPSGVCILLEITCSKHPALAGNRTRASRVAGENSTTEQPMPWKAELTSKAGNCIIKLFFQEYVPLCGLSNIVHPKKRAVLSPRRGIEPRSPAWQAGILTTILTRSWCGGRLKKRGALVLTIRLQCWALTLLTKTSV